MVGEGIGRAGALRIAGWGLAAGLLLLPLVAMRFTDEVRWDGTDFVFAAVLIGSVGVGLELAMRRGPNASYRAGAALALVTGFLMVWINAAVSIIGGEGSQARPLFLGVAATALGASALARFRPSGMARAMAATAAAQVAAPVVAQLAGLGTSDAGGATKAAVLTAGFAALWLASAYLFARAGKAN